MQYLPLQVAEIDNIEITIPDEEAEKIKTVGEAIDYIEKEIAKK